MRNFVKLVLLPALVALVVTFIVSPRGPSSMTSESAYDRVMNSGTLRCGYALWPGLLERDPNTNEFSGIMSGYMNALAQTTQLKIEWTQEIGYGDMPEALKSGKIDAFCGGAWTNAVRGKFVDPVTPITYQTVDAYVAANNTALDGNKDKINDPSVTISTIDGESNAAIAESDFPKAKTFSMPKNTDAAQLLLNVATGKATVTFVDPEAAHTFMTHNPGKIRKVKSDFPVRVYGVALWVGKGEQSLKDTLDNATKELLYTGGIEKVLKAVEKVPGSFIRVKMPFEAEPTS